MDLNYDFLPTYLQEIVKKLSDVYQIDSDYCLTALMSAVAASQGDRYQVIDPKGYRNATALWLCQVGVSGYGKSECGSWLMTPLLERERHRHEQYIKEKAEWFETDPKEREECPVEQKLVLNDYTPEALFDAMERSGANGILLYRDELQGWLKDIGRYGKSGEVEQYLSAWSQKSIRVTRLLRDDNFIERPCFSVFGGLQPDLLHEMLGKDDLVANGFNARLLFVFADESFSLEYFRESIPETMKAAYKALMDRLLKTPHSEVTFSSAAEQSYIRFWEDLQRRKTTENGMVRGLLSKLQIYVEKWAGLVELLANDGTPHPEISENTMDIAIAHTRAFEGWALKAYDYIKPSSSIENKRGIPNKKDTLSHLQHHWPNMNKNLVSQGLGIDRGRLSRDTGKAQGGEYNMQNGVSS